MARATNGPGQPIPSHPRRPRRTTLSSAIRVRIATALPSRLSGGDIAPPKVRRDFRSPTRRASPRPELYFRQWTDSCQKKKGG